VCEYRSIETILTEWRDGNETGWDEEFEWLEENHVDKLTALLEDIKQNGIREPILLGTDGRVWDGHHRIYCASILGIRMIPTERADA
jgi:hypothetical protein